MTTLGSDSFTRSNTANGTWGVATGGGSWSRPFGSATTYSVASNEGVINNTPGTWDHFTLGSTFTYTTTMDVLVHFIVDDPGENAGVLLRVASNGQTSYKVMYEGDGTTKGLYMYYDVAGSLVQIGSTVTFSVTAGHGYWIRGQINAGNLMGKIWADTGGEPGSWSVSASVGTHTISSGGFGVVGMAISNLKFDNFTATDGTNVVNQPVTYINTVASSETQSNALHASPTGTTAIVDTPIIRQSATMSNTTVIAESINAGTFQQVVNNNTTATAESVSVSLRALPTDVTAVVESVLMAQRASPSNTSVILDQSTATSQPATSSTDPNSQMLYDDLQIQYQRIRGSSTNAHVAVLALVYYPPAQVLSEHAVPGELDVQLTATGAWSQLRTINDVTAFLATNP